LTTRRADTEAELSAVSEEIADRAIETREMSENIEYEFSFGVLSRPHHLSDRLFSFADEMPLGDPKDIKKDIIHLPLALQFVAQSRFFLLLRKFGESSDMFGLDFIRYDSETLKSSLIVWSEFETSIKDARGTINIVGAKSEVIPTDSLKRERDKAVLRGLYDAWPLLSSDLPDLIEIGKPDERQDTPG
jgi:hypothetical protein